MKGSAGLLVALGLGLLGAVLNYTYLASKAADMEAISFLAIKPNQIIRPGDTIRQDQLTSVDIPKDRVGLLANTAYRYDDRGTVAGMRAVQHYTGGEILRRDDFRTPPQELKPGPNESVLGIPVDTRTFVPSLVTPGNQISFLVPKSAANQPTPAAANDADEGTPEPQAVNTGPVEIVGPFRVLSLGNRLGSAEVLKAAGIPQVQENVMNIAVRVEEGKLEARAQRLVELLMRNNFRQVGVLLHPKTEAPK